MQATVISSAVAVAFAILALPLLLATPAVAEKCVTKSGSATGPTRGFAQYESKLIIYQVTGNWPFQTDRISKPTYSCKHDGLLWTCRATARVCKG